MFGTGFGAQSAFGASTGAGFGSTSFGTFGAPSQPAFGAPASAPAFGAASTPAFGASPAPAFGAASTPAFGATSPFGGTSAFGASSQPASAFGSFSGGTAFGAASQPAFGGTGLSTAFGQPTQSAFGATSAPAFGAASTGSVFGAATASAFGTSQAASPFGGTTAFGAQSAAQPAFGATGSLFGASAPAASPFSAAPATGGGLFGQPAAGAAQPGFGAAQPGATGTRIAPYQKTIERDGTSTSTGATPSANFITISAMQLYQNKSLEELRWEDYQAGVKHAGAAPAPAAAPAFGSPAAATSHFQPLGGAATATPAFGASTSAFGTPSAAPSFGGGGLFGSAQSAAAPAFGSTTPAFGSTSTNPFQAASTPAFGATSAPAFGGTSLFGQSSPAFGAAASKPATSSFSFSTAPATGGLFGQSSASAFGQASAPSMFGSTSATTGGLFGSSPAFGATSFATPGTASSPFGTQSAFGATKPASTFGTPNLFGPSTAASGFGSSSPSLFGQTGTGLFGQTGGGLFASSAAPSIFSSSTSLFGASSSPSMFSTPLTGQLGQPAGGFQLQPFPGAGTAGAGAAAVPLSVSAAPYGAFPTLPTVPEPKVGISARPARTTSAGAGAGALRASPLVSLRATASGSTNKLGAAAQMASRPASLSPLGSLGVVVSDTGATASAGATPAGTPGGLRARSNPHQLFIREMPPSTQPASGSGAFSPAHTPGPAVTPAGNKGGRDLASPFNPFTPLSGTRTGRVGDGDADGHQENGAGPSNGARAGGRSASAWEGTGHDGVGTDGTPVRGTARRPTASDYSYLPQLGRLAEQSYYYEPSSTQLDAMHQSDPESLAKVSNFTVGREGIGSIRWLKPVDVRGLLLDTIVTIQHGEVFCYAQGEKPPVGKGLNTEAEITLLGVYKKDKATGQQVRDGPALIKWEKKLRQMCATMDAKFVSYKAAGGVWKFEVEHFSRYGLIDDDSEFEDDFIEVSHEQQPQQASTPQRSFGLSAVTGEPQQNGTLRRGEGVSDGDGMEEGVEVGTDAMEEGEAEGAVGSPGPIEFDRGFGNAAPLQHSLPTHLNLEPNRLLMLRETFFAPSGPTTTTFPAQSGPAQGSQLVPNSAPGGSGQQQQPSMFSAHAPVQQGTPVSTTTRRRHVWRSVAPPVSTTRPLPAASTAPPAAAVTDQTLALAPTGGEGAVFRPVVGASSAEAAAAGRDAQHLADAGLSLGLSFRVGWGPNGTLVVPGPPGLKLVSAAQPIIMTRACVEGRSSSTSQAMQSDAAPSARLTALRVRLKAMLDVHRQHSHPCQQMSADSTWLPQWKLLTSNTELPSLVTDIINALVHPDKTSGDRAAGASAVAGDDASNEELDHHVETWRLLQVLFEAQPEGMPAANSAVTQVGPSMGADSQLGVADMDASTPRTHSRGNSYLETDNRVLLDMHRQSNFSSWLQRQVMQSVRDALQTARSPCDAVLQLLTAHHLAGAAALAAAAGDVRLATLLAAGGLHASIQADAARQLDIWANRGMTASIDPSRLLVYRLLAGQATQAFGVLPLDWRSALGLLLWYQAASSTHSGHFAFRNQSGHTAEAVAAYGEMLASGQPVPAPVPPYVRSSASHITHFHQPMDLQYVLLQVWANHATAAANAAQQENAEQGMGDDAFAVTPAGAEGVVMIAVDGTVPAQPVPAALLASSGHSSNPCAAALPWCVLSVLQALGVLHHTSDAELRQKAASGADMVSEQQQLDLQISAHMALVSELLLAGDACEWAIYVALHLPDAGDSANQDLQEGSSVRANTGLGVCRNRVVRELLQRTAPEWTSDTWRETFLKQALHIPEVLLQEAKALLAASEHDLLAACRCHLAAQQWCEAHELLVSDVAPTLLCEHRLAELEPLLLQLQPRAHMCPDWQIGGGMYLDFLQRALPRPASSAAGHSPVSALQQLASSIAQAREAVIRQLPPGTMTGMTHASNTAAAASTTTGALPLPAAASATQGAGNSGASTALLQGGRNQLRQLVALERMARDVQAAIMPALAAQHGVARAVDGAGSSAAGVVGLLSACGMQSATRATALAVASQQIASQLLAS